MNKIKRLIVLAAAAAVSISCILLPAAPASALSGKRGVLIGYQNLTIEIDGKTIIPKDAAGNTVYPFVYDGRTYLPVRALAIALGCGVSWNGATQTVSVTSAVDGAGPSYGTPARKSNAELTVIEYANISVKLDGAKLALANEPFLFMDSVYLPLRELADALKCGIAYVESTNVIQITKTPAPNAPPTPAPNAPPTPAPSAAQAPMPTPKPMPTPAPSQALTQAHAPAPSPPYSGAAARAGTASPGPASYTPKPAATPGSFSSADLAVVIANKTVKPGQNISAVKELLGAPSSYEEVESCAYVGLDKFYVFGKIEVSTLPIDGDQICAIDVFDSSASSSKNVTVGSARAQIEAAYGKGYTLENGVLIYWDGPKGNPKTPQLYFMLDRNDKVESFGVYNGKSAG